MAPDSTHASTVDEEARRRFEAARRAGDLRPLEDFLPGNDHPHYLNTLEELVAIDQEFAWKARVQADASSTSEPPPLESYLARFPQLNQPEILRRLRWHEHLLRRQHGEELTLSQDRKRSSATMAEAEPTAPAADGAPLPRHIPGYEILSELGRGGMGVVYKARHLRLNRLAALKMIGAGIHAGSKELARFQAEAEVVAQLQHPNIVQIQEVGQCQGCPWFAMEYLDGGSLRDQLKGTPLAPREAAELAEKLAWAVSVAHQRGIVHRDLKPANILLQAHPDQHSSTAESGSSRVRGEFRLTKFEPKIADFGLAKWTAADQGLTQTGDILGTPSYMAPEQADGKAVGPAADIYGLGAILYELLTGRPPFRAATSLETLRQVTQDEPVPPRRMQPHVPLDLQTISLKCLQKDPTKRYPNAQALAEDLRRFLEDRPIQARPTPAWERAWKSAKRRPTLAALIGVIIGAAAAILGLIIMSQFRLQQERDLAEKQRQEAVASKEKAVRAAEAEKEAKVNAETREAETRAVLDFVQSKILAAARPFGQDGGLGHDVTLRKALETALPSLNTTFKNQPRVEARLRMALGISFSELSEPKIAAEQFEIARQLYTQELGPGHRDTLESMAWLAICYFALGRHLDALHLREETLRLRQENLGPSDRDTIASMLNLANSYGAVGRMKESHNLAGEALVIARAKLRPEDSLTLWLIHTVAMGYQAEGRLSEALELYEEALRGRQAALGAEHPETLASISDLATCYAALGRHAEAAKLNEQTLEIRKARLGTKHAQTLASMHNLAANYDDLGRHAEALKLYEETLGIMKSQLGLNHSHTLLCMAGVARSLIALDRGLEALPIIDDGLQRCRAQVGNANLIQELMDLRFQHFQKLKDVAGCRKTAEMWENLQRSDADSLYQSACQRAVLAGLIRSAGNAESVQQSNAEADRAMTWLRQAIAAGYRAADIKIDKSLDPLRNRDDFKKLVESLR
jgi:serine/threonine protein kinase